GQRVYPLTNLLAGERPEGLELSESVLESRNEGVEVVMADSSGADFPERTEPPEPTGDPADDLPRSPPAPPPPAARLPPPTPPLPPRAPLTPIARSLRLPPALCGRAPDRLAPP